MLGYLNFIAQRNKIIYKIFIIILYIIINMCGGDCPCDGSGCGGCKYGCWGVMAGSSCLSGGCCDKPAPTCGCCEDVLSGETCLDKTYYLVLYNYSGNTENTEGKTTVYVYITFENCIATAPVSGLTVDEGITNFMIWAYQDVFTTYGITSEDNSNMTLTTTEPSNAFFLNTGASGLVGEHCFFWLTDDLKGDAQYFRTLTQLSASNSVFTEYDTSDCSYQVPNSQLPLVV